MNENASCFTYMIESFDMWHGRLRHVNVGSIKRLKILHLINVSDSHGNNRCPICVEVKFLKSLLNHNSST